MRHHLLHILMYFHLFSYISQAICRITQNFSIPCPTLMPKKLLQAHRQNDRAVMQAYAFPVKMTESECVAELFKLYTKLAES